jgi:hypothetical protein
MSKARKQVQDMIRRKAKKFEELRTNSSRSLTPQQIVFKFFRAMEEAKKTSIDSYDFGAKLNKESELLNSRIEAFDIGVNIELMWHNNELADSWKDLKLNGVKIIWSSVYRLENPNIEPEAYIDIGHYLLEGLDF